MFSYKLIDFIKCIVKKKKGGIFPRKKQRDEYKHYENKLF